MELSYSAEAPYLSKQQKGDNAKIENSKQSIQYKGYSQEQGAQMLLQKKASTTSFRFAFDLRYYPAYQGF